MNIQKGTQVSGSGVPTPEQLKTLNQLARTAMTAEQVYVFSLRLCDDRIDRDMERFDRAALPILAKLFVGKTGITDHRWSTEAQVARIFQTEVVQEQGVSYIKAWAYIRRGGKGEEVIEDIEAGIKKEVSVGCAMGKAVCSICGEEYGTCGHQKGSYYGADLCHVILQDPTDAYEFSFVAVPAQPEAGVIKTAGGVHTLKELAEEFGVQAELRSLQQQAQLGREYEKQLQQEVVRLMLCLDLGIEEPILQSMTGKIGARELKALKSALDDRVAELYPARTQLHCPPEEKIESGFLI